MKKLNLNILQKSILVFCLSIFVISCSKDDSIETQALENVSLEKRNSSDYSVSYEDYHFLVNDKGEAAKYEGGRFQYNMIPSEEFMNQITFSEHRGIKRLEHVKTGEFIEIVNLTKSGRGYTFDVITSLGHTLKGIKLSTNNNQVDVAQKFCWPCLILPVAGMIVELLTDSPQVECSNALNLLNCQAQGLTGYMNFNEGGLFSGASCTVYCQ
ncbi:hypothetical protein [uncultured Aquimarina sp.]|uniref:hypothetical protein n=1 Tax=uncultured Aquimarina sp. TaxID=575652 RepID=UPI00260E4A16|nr:hypothetical protein [uncultured Aquimarina sp.]